MIILLTNQQVIKEIEWNPTNNWLQLSMLLCVRYAIPEFN